MISESEYWKSDLQKNVSFFYDKLYQSVWKNASYAALEKRVMLSCYIVRKLAEANKITKDRYNTPVPLYSYKSKGKTVDLLNWHRIEELYETEAPDKITKPFSYVVNQIVHSFTFLFAFKSKNKIEGILFNSDRSKKNELYMLKIADLIDVLSPIAQCYVGRIIMERNKNGELVAVLAEENH